LKEEITQIRTTKQLKDLAKTLKVGADWHEPDEQEVEVKVEGSHLDNAFMELTTERWPNREFNVIILQDKKPVAWINLANLFAMAVDTWPDTGEPKGTFTGHEVNIRSIRETYLNRIERNIEDAENSLTHAKEAVTTTREELRKHPNAPEGFVRE